LFDRMASPEQISQQRRRASALALLKEEIVRSCPSWIAELRRKSPAGIERSAVFELEACDAKGRLAVPSDLVHGPAKMGGGRAPCFRAEAPLLLVGDEGRRRVVLAPMQRYGLPIAQVEEDDKVGMAYY
jgi:hypothetical protein